MVSGRNSVSWHSTSTHSTPVPHGFKIIGGSTHYGIWWNDIIIRSTFRGGAGPAPRKSRLCTTMEHALSFTLSQRLKELIGEFTSSLFTHAQLRYIKDTIMPCQTSNFPYNPSSRWFRFEPHPTNLFLAYITMFSKVFVELTSLQHPLCLLDKPLERQNINDESMPMTIPTNVNILTLGFSANAQGQLALSYDIWWPGETSALSASFPLTLRPTTTNQEVARSAPSAWFIHLSGNSLFIRCVSNDKGTGKGLIPNPERANRKEHTQNWGILEIISSIGSRRSLTFTSSPSWKITQRKYIDSEGSSTSQVIDVGFMILIVINKKKRTWASARYSI